MFPSFRRFARALAARLTLSNATPSQRKPVGRGRMFVEELEPRALPSVNSLLPTTISNQVPAYVANSIFQGHGPGWQVYLQPNADAVLVVPNPTGSGPSEQVLRLHFLGANKNIQATGLNVGHRPRLFAMNGSRPAFAQVDFRNVYPGIDVIYQQNSQKHFEYSFIVHPGANPARIQAIYQGAQGMHLDSQGNVIINWPSGSMIQQAPLLFQRANGVRQQVSGFSWLDANNQIRFQSNAYDPRRVLLIDPLGNSPPMANGDGYPGHHDHQLVVSAPGVLANDADFDHDPLAAVLVTGASHGSVSLASDGSFTYTPNPGFYGFDSFFYRAFDGQAYSNQAQVNIWLSEFPPTANADSYSTPHGQALAAGVLGNDTDGDGDALTAVLTSNPSHGELSYFGSDGSFLYVPIIGYVGSDSFTYKANDGIANSLSATVTISVTNTVPTANDDSYGVQPNAAINVVAAGVLANDVSGDGDALTAVLASGPSHGTLTLNDDGSFAYTPNTGFTGSDSFTYKAADDVSQSSSATVTLNVHSSNQAPTANADSVTAIHDTPLTVDPLGILANDTDPDGDPLTSVLVSGPSHGTLNLNANGSFTYTPNANYVGSDAFTYKANDGIANSGSATVSIAVTNTAPVAGDATYAVQPNVTLTVSSLVGVLASAFDEDGDALSAQLVNGPSHGTLTLSSDGSFSYTPVSNFTGTDSFTYKVTDGIDESNSATVTLNIHSTNHSPVANNDLFSTRHDTTLTVQPFGILGNDTDSDFDKLTASLVSGVSHGTLTLNGDGSFAYVPSANYVGTDSFSYKAGDGIDNSNTATVTIQVTDGTPLTGADSYNVTHGQTLTVAAANGLLLNDSDPDGDPITASLVSNVSHGTLTLSSNGSFVYVPAVGYAGTDSFTYVANDGMVDGNIATVTIDVRNFAPVTGANSYSTKENTALSVSSPGVLGNDTDPDGDSVTASLVSGPSHGSLTLNSNGSFTYTPNSSYTGIDSFTYEAYDGIAYGNTATVAINVTNQTLVANNDVYVVDGFPDGQLVVSGPGVLANDTDSDPEATLTATLLSGPSTGSVTLNSDGSFTYVPDQETFNVSDSFTYTVSDGVNEAMATVFIQENPPRSVDLQVDGLNNVTEDTVGGLVVENWDDNDAPRHKITMAKAVPNDWVGSLRLTISQGEAINVYTVPTGAGVITFNGTDNVFRNADLPKDLWVEGEAASSHMRDHELKLEAIVPANPPSDTVKFTVLWLQIDVRFTGPVTNENACRERYIRLTEDGLGGLGLQKYVGEGNNIADRLRFWGYGFEVSGRISPDDFDILNTDLHLDRDAQARKYERSSFPYGTPKDYQNSIPPGNDTSPPGMLDNDPRPSGVIYDLDAPGINQDRSPLGDIRRMRFNARSFAAITVEGRSVRASLVREYFVRYSVIQDDAPQGTNWVINVQPATVPDDNQHGYGQTAISWNLR